MDGADALNPIFEAIDEVNRQLPLEDRLEKSESTVLFGESGKLDSLGLINFVVTAEQKIERAMGAFVSLTDERILGEADSPLRTVRALVEYVTSRLADPSNPTAPGA